VSADHLALVVAVGLLACGVHALLTPYLWNPFRLRFWWALHRVPAAARLALPRVVGAALVVAGMWLFADRFRAVAEVRALPASASAVSAAPAHRPGPSVAR
jgi:hypothetical protein